MCFAKPKLVQNENIQIHFLFIYSFKIVILIVTVGCYRKTCKSCFTEAGKFFTETFTVFPPEILSFKS